MLCYIQLGKPSSIFFGAFEGLPSLLGGSGSSNLGLPRLEDAAIEAYSAGSDFASGSSTSIASCIALAVAAFASALVDAFLLLLLLPVLLLLLLQVPVLLLQPWHPLQPSWTLESSQQA